MPGTIAVEEVEVKKPRHGGTGSGRGNSSGNGGPRGGGNYIPRRTYITGVTVGLSAVLMLFMALVSAFIVRRGASTDWMSLVVPKILWLTTAILIASSCTLVRARKLLAVGDIPGYRRWWLTTTTLGMLFLAGQLMAWYKLVNEGVYLATNPSSSFFYVFTAFHGLHLLGGIIGLLYVALRPVNPQRQMAITEAAAMYWHFMDGLWVFIFLLFYIGK